MRVALVLSAALATVMGWRCSGRLRRGLANAGAPGSTGAHTRLHSTRPRARRNHSAPAAFNRATSSATESTLMPPLRTGGSSTRSTRRRVAVSTFSSAGVSFVIGFFLAFCAGALQPPRAAR